MNLEPSVDRWQALDAPVSTSPCDHGRDHPPVKAPRTRASRPRARATRKTRPSGPGALKLGASSADTRGAIPDPSRRMVILRKALAACRRTARLFFVADVRLKLRGGMQMELLTEAPPAEATPDEQAARQRRLELHRIVVELDEVLGQEPEIRDRLRHLVYIEQALRVQGLRLLETVPLTVLVKALEQFEGLVTNWSPQGLATLRSKMAVALGERRARGEEAPADQDDLLAA